MNKTKSITIILLTLALFNCKKDVAIPSKTNETEEGLYTPSLLCFRNNGKVTLNWKKPSCCGSQLNPDHFEILMSNTNPSDLNAYGTVSNNIFELPISNLINGTPYYFAVKAVGENGEFSVSKTIMTIPDNPENIQPLLPTINKSLLFGSTSPNQSLITYVSDYFYNNGNSLTQAVFISTVTNGAELLVEKSSYCPEWSPSGQKLVYHTDNGQANTAQGYRPTHISTYNIPNNIIKRLTGGNSFNYLPTWSPDGNWIAFLSDKAGSTEYNIWKIPSDSGTATQITSDFNDLSEMLLIHDRSPNTLSWSNDGNSIVFARKKKTDQVYDYDIYSVPSNGGNKTTILSSQWNDICPVYSPDGATLAFISDRSGSNEIWTMNLQTKKLRQVTGSTAKWINETSGKLNWSTAGDKILFVSIENNFFTPFSVDVN